MDNLETDQVFLDFLSEQYQRGMELDRESDLVELEAVELQPIGEESCSPPVRYRLKLHCRGLVREPGSQVSVVIGMLFRAPPRKLIPAAVTFPIVVAYIFNNWLELRLPVDQFVIRLQ